MSCDNFMMNYTILLNGFDVYSILIGQGYFYIVDCCYRRTSNFYNQEDHYKISLSFNQPCYKHGDVQRRGQYWTWRHCYYLCIYTLGTFSIQYFHSVVLVLLLKQRLRFKYFFFFLLLTGSLSFPGGTTRRCSERETNYTTAALPVNKNVVP